MANHFVCGVPLDSRTVGFNGSILAIASPRLSQNISLHFWVKVDVLLCCCQKSGFTITISCLAEVFPCFFFVLGCFRAKKTHWGSTPHMCRSNHQEIGAPSDPRSAGSPVPPSPAGSVASGCVSWRFSGVLPGGDVG